MLTAVIQVYETGFVDLIFNFFFVQMEKIANGANGANSEDLIFGTIIDANGPCSFAVGLYYYNKAV